MERGRAGAARDSPQGRSGLVRYGMSGAVVAAVKDGRVLFSKGFGFADLARHKPMTTELASITRVPDFYFVRSFVSSTEDLSVPRMSVAYFPSNFASRVPSIDTIPSSFVNASAFIS